ncbi:MAG: 2-oxoacid:ferredoxin oxidoreductase subunit beta [Desulfovibrionaceae bacterium]|nr:2-oxoacid:ferredoxin oxidoreductase subunit beta [Desulfovibrionaceae bacterium]
MVGIEDYGEFETAWCPGCGNHFILKALKQALAGLGLAPHQVLMVSGIGQAAKTPLYLNCNMLTGRHGRALPAATGAKLANPGLTVIVESGDGCVYGEGGNHFLAAMRRNIGLTLVVHDNQIYGLTKGQASPTTAQGHKTKAQPLGQPSEAFNPIAVAVAMRAGFVARGFSGDVEHLAGLMAEAVRHPGFALVDILQPCVTFNKVNTFAWYKQRCKKVDGHDPGDWDAAMRLARVFGDEIPVGVIYKNDRPRFEAGLSGPMALRRPDMDAVRRVMDSFA